MRRIAHRASLVMAPLVMGLALALLASGANALDAPEDEREPDEPVATYAGTQMPDDHDPSRAAHPLRIVAYGLHPVGVALDWILVRPAVWVVRHEPFRTIFGYED
jgi:aryl-alcohol dehydrogenase-like predicted oxidoreductase